MGIFMGCKSAAVGLALTILLAVGVAFAQLGEGRGRQIRLDGESGAMVTLEVETFCLDYRKAAPGSRERLQLSSASAEGEVQRVLSVVRQWKANPGYRNRVLSRHPMYAELLGRAKLYREAMTCCEEVRASLEDWERVRPRWQRVRDLAQRLLSEEMLRAAAQRAVWTVTGSVSHRDLVQEALKRVRISADESTGELDLTFEAPYTQLLLDAAGVKRRWIDHPGSALPIESILRQLLYPSDPGVRSAEEAMLRLHHEAKQRFDVHFRHGLDALWDGRFETAAQELEQARQQLPQHVEALYLLGVAHFHQGKLERAVEAWEAAIGFDSHQADAYFNLALAYARLGRREEAIRAVSRLTALRPDDAEAKALRSRLAR